MNDNLNYELADSKDNIIETIYKYDIIDFIKKISVLNIHPKNQNKSILFDYLIEKIIHYSRDKYNSKHTISFGKFKNIISYLNENNLSNYIDPNENLFVENVSLDRNYFVYNGIDYCPAYNLQNLIDVIFYYRNDFPEEVKNNAFKILHFVLNISNNIFNKSEVNIKNYESDNVKEIYVPDSSFFKKNIDNIVFDVSTVKEFIGEEFYDDLIVSFGVEEKGNINYRNFYSRPFLFDEATHTIILLNVSLLATCVFWKIIKLFEKFDIKEKFVSKLNEYILRNCQSDLKSLGHTLLSSKQFNLEILSESNLIEKVYSVYNNQLMFVFFICDDLKESSEEKMHESYPDLELLNNLLTQRLTMIKHMLKNKHISEKDVFCMFILNAYGRVICLNGDVSISDFPIISLTPYELKCVKINECKNNNFIPRYLLAKKPLHISNSFVSELDIIANYVDNDYSFYIDDNVDVKNVNMFFLRGDSLDYKKKAMRKEDKHLSPSYVQNCFVKIICIDNKRNIYVEEEPFNKKIISRCIKIRDTYIWIYSREIKKEIEINIFYSMVDAISYWIAEAKELLENSKLCNNVLAFKIEISGNANDGYLMQNYDENIKDYLYFNKFTNILEIKPLAVSLLSHKSNMNEKEMARFVFLNIFNLPYDKVDLYLQESFSNPYKKKFYFIDKSKPRYLYPIVTVDMPRIYRDFEDMTLDEIGMEMINRYGYGKIPNDKRSNFSKEIVNYLYNKLRNFLLNINPKGVIETIYLDLEKVLYKIMLGKTRYAYDVACYPEQEEEFIDEFNELNKVSLALKFLIEYVAATPLKGDKILGVGEYNYLLAVCSMIIDWAYKDDLFHYEIFNTPIELLKSNRIGLKHKEFDNVFSILSITRKANLYYNSTSNFEKKYQIKKYDFYDDLNIAFEKDFGYSFNDYVNLVEAIITIGDEISDNEIYRLNYKELLSRVNKLINMDVGLINKIIEDISLQERDDFLIPPIGYRKEDCRPWRFKRAYSYNKRPLIKVDDDIIWGNRQVYHSMIYNLDSISEGTFKCKTGCQNVISLIGKISDSRGDEFNSLIVEMIKDLKVFKVFSKVKKINRKYICDELGNTYGDIDALVIDETKSKIYVCEIKDFKLSRNPYEMKSEYDKMFNDSKKKSFVTKHTQRVNWLTNHVEDLKIEYKLSMSKKYSIIPVYILNAPLISMNVYDKKINIIEKKEISINTFRKLK